MCSHCFRMKTSMSLALLIVCVLHTTAEFQYPKPELHLEQELTAKGGYYYPEPLKHHHSHNFEEDHHDSHVRF